MPRRKPGPLRRLLASLGPFVGGILCGVGGTLLLQVELARFARREIDGLGPLARLLGGISFLWRTVDEKLALALAEVPEGYLEHTSTVGIGLLVLGGPVLAMAAPWFLRRGAGA